MPRSAQAYNRRDFVRTAAAGLAVFPALSADGFHLTRAQRKSRVALVRTTDRKLGVTEVLKLVDIRDVAGKRVLLKPNFNTADDAPGSTHNDTLTQLIAELRERGARSVTLGESSGPPVTRNVMVQKGVFDLARDLRFDVVDYEQLPDNEWARFAPGGTHWPEGFAIPRLVLQSEYTVSTCCLKTHGSGGVFTMSLKLAVGLTPKPIRRTMHRSPDMRRMIAELNASYKPNLIVLDGVAAFTDGGPSRGVLKPGNVMIAGNDRIAVDAVGLAVLKELGSNDAIMNTKIFEQEQIARAVELGLGAMAPSEIDIVTADPDSRAYAEKLRGILALG
ncbi:MAG TPA: DUF362 domain-containing protein [Gemmatimonadaceae bacterium]|nr:DUF362 domain-containing protein [Gemmatimonadaceae bacterium]